MLSLILTGCIEKIIVRHEIDNKHRNRGERRFRNRKEFRRVLTRQDKLEETDNAFIAIANIIVFLRNERQHAQALGRDIREIRDGDRD
ncbi:MAG: hypothetical protein LBF88_06650 [Planctomycetaceae bacterium]|jgi:hypothetical protein|nr:hypothetical protein [Planctomycetaceae bacterium]